ncbi:hypothetical protein MESS2_1640029 [Mesorhizobium metallidurans STM 2683]|uniref:Uncharacterized protein n=1 Tax=Mesorhizobium metallidurans STM 2683 TaxID=1297569 RepID=M5F1L6_9HYPH|nr:hypothetical protein MESS2_1640029 [Mesorhizobium metallidurans STM 2683]
MTRIGSINFGIVFARTRLGLGTQGSSVREWSGGLSHSPGRRPWDGIRIIQSLQDGG